MSCRVNRKTGADKGAKPLCQGDPEDLSSQAPDPRHQKTSPYGIGDEGKSDF